jgi:hypothetical protein
MEHGEKGAREALLRLKRRYGSAISGLRFSCLELARFLLHHSCTFNGQTLRE